MRLTLTDEEIENLKKAWYTTHIYKNEVVMTKSPKPKYKRFMEYNPDAPKTVPYFVYQPQRFYIDTEFMGVSPLVKEVEEVNE
ncbi:MAG: hypothetical protein ACHQ1D_00555 [Nitrososphaerales archaeon]